MEKKTPEQLAREYTKITPDVIDPDRLRFSSKLEHMIAWYQYHSFLSGYKSRDEEIREILVRYTENLRDYERESHNLIGFDEREDEEFVDIFLKGE